jgi:hypothetical protein
MAASSATDTFLERLHLPTVQKVGRMRRLYFCALVLGFVGFFGNRINARDVAALTSGRPKMFCDYPNAYASHKGAGLTREPSVGPRGCRSPRGRLTPLDSQ